MANEDDEAKQKGMIEAYSAAIAAGEPLFAWAVHEILQVHTSLKGEAFFDFVFAQFPDSRATVARLVLTKEAAQVLKAALVANENIPDTPPPKRDQRSTQ